jgi:hypothetical protein
MAFPDLDRDTQQALNAKLETMARDALDKALAEMVGARLNQLGRLAFRGDDGTPFIRDRLAVTAGNGVDVKLFNDNANQEARLVVGTMGRWVSFLIDLGGDAITPGTKGSLTVPAGTIIEGRLLSDNGVIGSIVVDLWKTPFASAPGSVANSICGAARLTIVGNVRTRDTVLAGWTTSLSDGDEIVVNVVSVSTFTRVKLALCIK